MKPIRIILKAAKGPTGEYSSSWTLLPARDEVRAPSEVGGTPLAVARSQVARDGNRNERFSSFGQLAMSR